MAALLIFWLLATNRTDNNHGFKFYYSLMICKSAVQKNTIFAIHKSYNTSYNNLMLLITSQANVNSELRKNTGVTSFSGLWPRQRNQVAKHASDWFDKKNPLIGWGSSVCIFFTEAKRGQLRIYRAFHGGKGKREAKRGDSGGAPVTTTTTTTLFIVAWIWGGEVSTRK